MSVIIVKCKKVSELVFKIQNLPPAEEGVERKYEFEDSPRAAELGVLVTDKKNGKKKQWCFMVDLISALKDESILSIREEFNDKMEKYFMSLLENRDENNK